MPHAIDARLGASYPSPPTSLLPGAPSLTSTAYRVGALAAKGFLLATQDRLRQRAAHAVPPTDMLAKGMACLAHHPLPTKPASSPPCRCTSS
ncbi:hypothetical protein D9M68_470490 [compost metagenome]